LEQNILTLNNLALTYRDQGQWKEAEKLQVQVIQASKQLLGEAHPDRLRYIGDLEETLRIS
jgi:hypothetical protein